MTPESLLKVIDIAWAHFIRHAFSLYNDGIISASSQKLFAAKRIDSKEKFT